MRLRRGQLFAGALCGWACALFGVLSGASKREGRALTPYTVPAFVTPSAPEPLQIATSPLGTFLGVEDEMLLDRMRAQKLTRAKLNKGGSSISFRLEFADGSRAAFKPEQIHPQSVPRKEVAAYRLARLLGLWAVPPATMRRFHHDELLKSLAADATSKKNASKPKQSLMKKATRAASSPFGFPTSPNHSSTMPRMKNCGATG